MKFESGQLPNEGFYITDTNLIIFRSPRTTSTLLDEIRSKLTERRKILLPLCNWWLGLVYFRNVQESLYKYGPSSNLDINSPESGPWA